MRQVPPAVNNSALGEGGHGSSAVAGVDVDVLLREVAGPHASAAAAGAQVDNDGDIFREHLFVRDALVERMFAAAAANGDSREPDVDALEIEIDAGAAGGGEDAAPVGVGAGEGGFYERGLRDGARDLVGGAVGRGAANFDFDDVLRAFAIFDDRERERLADVLERGGEFFVVAAIGGDFAARRIRRLRAPRRCRWWMCRRRR